MTVRSAGLQTEEAVPMLDQVANLISDVERSPRKEALAAMSKLAMLFEQSTNPREAPELYESVLGRTSSPILLSTEQQAEVAIALCRAVRDRSDSAIMASTISVLTYGFIYATLPPLLSFVTSRWSELDTDARVHFCVMLRNCLLPRDQDGEPLESVLKCFRQSDPRALLRQPFLPTEHHLLEAARHGIDDLENYMTSRSNAMNTLTALILVDLQNDFVPSGALAVKDGDAVIPVANRLLQSSRFDVVVATQDWHPPGHGSFAANHPGRKPGELIELDGLTQVLWPVHCVQNTRGAQFVDALATAGIDQVFTKGTDPAVDSYSGFFDNGHRRSTGLGDFLKNRGVTDVYILGLATDYCVKFTALDAGQLGFNTYLVEDGCRGVELKPGDIERAVQEMKAAGVTITSSDQVQRTTN
jgi:nicotinamidase/pyrazinamidase